jgi:hypothetical protein
MTAAEITWLIILIGAIPALAWLISLVRKVEK